MKIKALALLTALAVTTVANAGSPGFSGDYVEVRSNHVLGGGCTYSAEADMDANQAIVAWRMGEGDMAGLSVVAVILGEGNLQLGEHARQTVLFIDSRATVTQKTRLESEFTERYAKLFGTVKKVETTAIAFHRENESVYTVSIPGQVEIATRAMQATDHEPSCDRMVWYAPFTADATATLVQTAQQSYSGSELISTWNIPNKRSAYVGAFSFAQDIASR
jgi:hypothetical protein